MFAQTKNCFHDLETVEKVALRGEIRSYKSLNTNYVTQRHPSL